MIVYVNESDDMCLGENTMVSCEWLILIHTH